jgi:membrane fusion protein, multidrug efflux system
MQTKLKSIAIGLAVVLCAAAGVFFLVRAHQAASASPDEEEKVPSVVSVQVGSLKRSTLHHYVEGYGMIETAPATAEQPAAGAPLAAPTAGVVARVGVVAGQTVNKGEVLMELNSGTLTVEYALQEVARQEKLYEQHNTSLKNLQNAQAQLDALRVIAPLSGTITRVNVRAGQAVDVTTVVAELADLNRLAVNASIPASNLNELKVGDQIQILTQPAVATEVYFISPAVDPSNDTVSVLALLPPQSGLRPGQFVQLHIVTAVHTNCLVAPEQSVITDIDGRSVLSRVSGNEATRMPVQTGFHENGWVEVSGPGLKEGDTVVTVGAYGLPDKTRISILNAPSAETAATNSPSAPAP